MATLKICTHDRTRWITDVKEVVIEEAFSVSNFDDPLADCKAPNRTRNGIEHVDTTVVDFQAPKPEEKVQGDTNGHVLRVYSHRGGIASRFVVPQSACFLMSDSGKTIDRI